MALVGESREGAEALAWVGEYDVDAVVSDAVMLGMGGAEHTGENATHFLDVPVVIMTTFDTAEVVTSVLDAGAGGLRLKESRPSRL